MTVLESNPRTGGRKFPLCNRRVADHHPFQNLHALANRSIEPEKTLSCRTPWITSQRWAGKEANTITKMLHKHQTNHTKRC